MTGRLLLNGRTLDLERAELCGSDGKPLPLRQQALSVLRELARQPGEVVTKRELMARVWPGLVVTDDSLVQCIVEIRRQLGDTQQRIVRTVPRRGYMLIGDAVPEPRAAEETPRRRTHFIVAGVAACAALAVAAWLFDVRSFPAFGSSTAADSDGRTLAVLPLRELTVVGGPPPPDGAALAYQISAELARNPDLRVISTLVTEPLRARGTGAREIGSTVGARYVVDGSVERRGERLVLDVNVVDTGTNRIAWSGRFEPTAEELPGVTQELIERIGGALGAAVRELHVLTFMTRAPATLDSHALALHGIALVRYRQSPEQLRQARTELERATRLDPNYPPAWAHLGWVKTLLIFSGSDRQLSRQDHPQAIADIKRAIALEPMSAASWRLLSLAINSAEAPEEAVSAAERAVQLGPGDPDNWLALGLAQYHARGPEAALRNIEKALAWHRLQPPWYSVVEARLRYALRDYERALRASRDCLERVPAIALCKAIWLSAQVRSGHPAEAEAAWSAFLAASPALQTYRFAPRGTPEAKAVDEDLDALRAKTGIASK